MLNLIERLAEMISHNGYEVSLHQDSAGYLFDIVHQPTQREAVYAFNTTNRDVAVRAMARQYCTDDQLNELAGAGIEVLEPLALGLVR